MPNPRFIARFEAKNLRLEIWINSIPAAIIAPGESAGIVSLPLNEFITPGKNRLGAMLHAGPLATRLAEPWANDPAAATYTGPASLRLRLGVYASGESVLGADPEPALAAIDWEGAAEATPTLIGREFDGVDAMGHWAWQDAIQIGIGAGSRSGTGVGGDRLGGRGRGDANPDRTRVRWRRCDGPLGVAGRYTARSEPSGSA